MITAVILSTVLAAVAVVKRALTPGGVILAWFFCVIITYLGSVYAFVILAETFVFTIFADGLVGKRVDPHQVRKKSGARDSARVFCNVGTGTISILLFGITQNQAFYIAYACVMAASLADSIASKIGPLSKIRPVDICTFRKIDTGLSGGVSLLGLAASLLGGVLIGVTFALFNSRDFATGAIVAVFGFGGSIIDSVLGSTIQVKYACPCCGQITEREEHCGTATKVYKSFRWINNDMVNFMSNLFVFFLAMLIFSLQN